MIRFDERDGEAGRPEFDRNARESGAGPDVGESRGTLQRRGRRGTREEVAGGEEAFSEVAGDDLVGIADRG